MDSVVSNEGLDVLINNAGILDKSSIYEVTSELMEKSLRVNAVGPLMIVQVINIKYFFKSYYKIVSLYI